jgi:hypothetical protein
MGRRLIALLVLVAASAALVAAPAAATPPPLPPQPPSAYVPTSNYSNGCSDWYLRSSYPMSTADPKWVFTCSNDWAVDDSYYGTSSDSYYWNAALQQAILFEQTVWDSSGWFWDCTLYPFFVGACQE